MAKVYLSQPTLLGNVGKQTINTRKVSACALLSHLVYAANGELTTRASAALGGGGAATYITPGTIVPNYLRFTGGDVNIFAFAGTNDIPQLLYYSANGYMTLWTDPMVFPGPVTSTPRVCAGFYYLFTVLKQFLKTDFLALNKSTPIVFTGHSLGGAIAQMFGVYAQHILGFTNVSVVTFGSPKVGDIIWGEVWNSLHEVTNFWRRRDIIPSFPPHLGPVGLRGPQLACAIFDYQDAVQPFLLDRSDRIFGLGTWGWLHGGVSAIIEAFYNNRNPLLIGEAFKEALASHYMKNYVRDFLFFFRNDESEDMAAIQEVQFVLLLSENDPNVWRLNSGSGVWASILNFVDIINPWSPLNVGPLIPQPTATTWIENRTVEHLVTEEESTSVTGVNGGNVVPIGDPNPFLEGSPGSSLPRQNWEFKGKDRAIMVNALRALQAAQIRDGVAAISGPTQAISTRQQFFPWDNEPLLEAVASVLGRLAELLSLTRG